MSGCFPWPRGAGANLISFARTGTQRGIEYALGAKEPGWSFLLKGIASPGARYYVNGRPVPWTSSGLRLRGVKNHVLVVPGGSDS